MARFEVPSHHLRRHAELVKHRAWSGYAADPALVTVRARSFETKVSPDDAERSALYWDFASGGAIKHAPHGEILGNVLHLMLDSRSHKQQVA